MKVLPQQGAVKAEFNHEGPDLYRQAYAQNRQYAKPPVTLIGAVGPYQTPLAPKQELAFRQWVAANRIPFNPDARVTDYDMRGYWLANQAGKAPGRAANGHFTDEFKTPYDTTFSAQSRYALPGTPLDWIGNSLVNGATGRLIFT